MKALLLIKQAEQDNDLNPAYGLYGAGAAAGIGAGVMGSKDMKNINEVKKKIEPRIKVKENLLAAKQKIYEPTEKYYSTLINKYKLTPEEAEEKIKEIDPKIKELNSLDHLNDEQSKIRNNLILKKKHYKDNIKVHKRDIPKLLKEKQENQEDLNKIKAQIKDFKDQIPGFSTKTKLLGAGAVGLIGAGAYLQHKQNQKG